MQTVEPVPPEAEVAESHVVERPATHLKEREHNLLKEMLRPGAAIESIIPPDPDSDGLWATLDTCVRGLNLLEVRSTRLKLIIGKILVIFENKPSLYKELGYETYSDFMRYGVHDKLGLHRTSAYEGKMAARDWPQMTPDQYAEIGPKKMGIIAKTGIKGSNSNASIMLDTARHMKVQELKDYLESRGMVARGETTGATFTINTNLNRRALFAAFFGDGRVHSVVGSKDWDRILEAMIQETYDEWVSRHEEALAAKNAATYQPVV